MTSIDNKVVELRFNNSQFESEATRSLSTLDKLKAALKLDGASRGFKDINAAAKSTDIKSVADNVEQTGKKFNLLQAAGTAALAAIATKALSIGPTLMKMLPMDDIMAGFGEYEVKMGSIQTILANTARHGTTLKQVTGVLDELNGYADKTIYSFGDMTRNIGLFTNAGLKVEDAAQMIKGFSNEAAASGTTSQAAAGAAYQLSQALSAGQIRLMDWRSLTNVGMGNKNMQQGIIDVAIAMGVLTAGSEKSEKAMKDFNGSLESGWLSADVMSNYLKIMANDMDEASMKSIGLSDAQIEAFKKQAQTAEDAATKVRTLTQLTGSIAEATGSSWAASFDIILGDFDEATELFTMINENWGLITEASATKRNTLLQEWKDLGGRAAIIDGLAAAWNSVYDIMGYVKSAFAQVFTPSGKNWLYEMSVGFQNFMRAIQPTHAQLAVFHSALVVFFTTLKILGSIVVDYIVSNFRILQAALGVVIEFLTYILDQANNALTSFMEGFNLGKEPPAMSFFERLANIVDILVQKLIGLKQAGVNEIVGILNGARDAIRGWADLGASIDYAGRRTAFMNAAGQELRKIWDNIKITVSGTAGIVGKAKALLGQFFSTVGSAISEFWSSLDFSGLKGGGGGLNLDLSEPLGRALNSISAAFAKFDVGRILAVLNSGMLIAGLKYVRDMLGTIDSIREGIEQFAGVGESLNKSLGAASLSLKADAVKSLVASLALLAAAFWIISKIDGEKIGQAAAGMAIGIGALVGTLIVIEKVTVNPGKMIAIGIALTAMAAAIALFGVAVLIFSQFSWEDLGKGLAGFTGAIAVMVATALLLDKVKGNIIGAAIGLQGFAVAMMMMAGAIALFGIIPFPVLVQGLQTMGIVLGGLVIFLNLLRGMNLLEIGAGLTLVAVALNLIVVPIIALGLVPIDILTQGMIALGLAMLGLAVAARIAQGSLTGVVAIAAMALAVNMLVGPLLTLGLIPFPVLIQGLLATAAVLGLLALSANLMVGALPGAAAIVAISVALTLLSVAIIMLGTANPQTVIQGLMMMAGAILLFAAAAFLLAPVIPLMIGMAGAIALFGLAVLAIGVGIVVLSAGLVILGAAAVVGAAGIKLLAMAILELVPHTAGLLGVGAAFLVLGAGLALAGVGVIAVAAGLVLLAAGLLALGLAAPVGVVGFEMLLEGMKKVAAEAASVVIATGVLIALGAGAAVAAVGTAALGVALLALAAGILAFSDSSRFAASASRALGPAMDKLGDAANKAGSSTAGLVAFGNAARTMGDSFRSAQGSMNSASQSLLRVGQASMTASNQVSSVPRVMSSSFGQVIGVANNLASTMVKMGANINGSMMSLQTTMRTGGTVMTTAMNQMASSTASGSNRVVSSITSMSSRVTSSIRSMSSSVGAAAVSVGQAIINGMVRGMSNSSKVSAAARSVALRALASAKSALGVASPSKEFEKIGKFVNEGFVKGLTGSKSEIDNAFNGLHEKVKEGMAKSNELIKKYRDQIASIEKKSNKKRTAEDRKNLDEARKRLLEAEELRWRTYQANDMILGMQKNEEKQLQKLRKEYDKLTSKLDEANRSLDEAIQKRDDAAKGWTDNYGKLDDMSFEKGENLDTYMKDLEERYNATRKYNKDLQRLRDMGLDDEIYKDLVDKGIDGQAFVSQLLDGGWGAVENLNDMNRKLDKEAGKLGDNAARELYQAGVDAAQGIVDGLEAKRDAIAKEMEAIADALVKALKWKLGIKSPSTVFAKLGEYTVQGFAKGVRKSYPAIDDSMNNVGDRAKDSLRKTLAEIPEVLQEEMNLEPIITPIVDYSNIKDGLKPGMPLVEAPQWFNQQYKYGGQLWAGPWRVDDHPGILEPRLLGPTEVNYIQNNNSPKALSNAEIYRQTRNQLSRLKEGVTK